MYPTQYASAQQQQRVLHHANNADSYAIFNRLTGPQLLDRVEALLPDHRECQFPPTETLSMFIAQMLSEDGSCQQAVDDAAVKRLVGGLKPCSTNTSGYCQARARLPLPIISTLVRQTGKIIAEDSAATWWHAKSPGASG